MNPFTIHFYCLYFVGVTSENNYPMDCFYTLLDPPFYGCYAYYSFLSNWRAERPISVEQGRAFTPHTGNCLLDFLLLWSNRSGCMQVAVEETGDGKCTINAVGEVCTGNKLFLVSLLVFCNICSKHRANAKLLKISSWSGMAVTLLNSKWQH